MNANILECFADKMDTITMMVLELVSFVFVIHGIATPVNFDTFKPTNVCPYALSIVVVNIDCIVINTRNAVFSIEFALGVCVS